MTQAVEDGATRPVFYESRVINLKLDAETLKRIDSEYEAMADEDEEHAITKELTEALRNNKTIDWNVKESARAGMRRIVKRLLKKYKYPPEGEEDALNIIMTQCNKWSENN